MSADAADRLACPAEPIEVLGLQASTRVVRRPDGRGVAYSVFGDPFGAATLLYGHGSGSCRLEAAAGDTLGRALGVRIIAADRPGHGRSDPWPGRGIADHVDDLVAVADAEGAGRFAVGGYSGGAPHALAAAVLRPDRVTAAVLVNTAGDRASPAWARQPLRSRILIGALVLRPVYRLVHRSMLRKIAQGAAEGATPQARFMQVIFQEGGRQGMDAVWQELDLFYRRSWGLDVASLAAPALLLHGMADPNLPFARGLASMSARIALEVIPGGHMDGGTQAVWRRVLDEALRAARRE